MIIETGVSNFAFSTIYIRVFIHCSKIYWDTHEYTHKHRLHIYGINTKLLLCHCWKMVSFFHEPFDDDHKLSFVYMLCAEMDAFFNRIGAVAAAAATNSTFLY